MIGEFEVRDIHDQVQWGVLENPREANTAALWRQVANEIKACIATDLAGGASNVAKVEP